MKNIFNIAFACIVLCGALQGAKAWGEWRVAGRKIAVLDEQVRALDAEERKCARLKSAPPVSLEDAYVALVDDLASIARACGLGLAIEGGQPLFGPSSLDGLKETRIKVVFSRVPRRGALVSLLGILDARALIAPFLVEKMTQEKDSLVMEVVVFGI